MHRLTVFLHGAAGRHAKRIRVDNKIKGQAQLTCSERNDLDEELGYLSQLQYSRQIQYHGSKSQKNSSRQQECHQHCAIASTFFTQVLSHQIRVECAVTTARQFSASAKGPHDGHSRAGQSDRQASQPGNQPAGHNGHGQTQSPWQQPNASLQSSPLKGAPPQQSRPVTAFAPGEPVCIVPLIGSGANSSCGLMQKPSFR